MAVVQGLTGWRRGLRLYFQSRQGDVCPPWVIRADRTHDKGMLDGRGAGQRR
jgi:hypothetical protein